MLADHVAMEARANLARASTDERNTGGSQGMLEPRGNEIGDNRAVASAADGDNVATPDGDNVRQHMGQAQFAIAVPQGL